MDISEGLLQLHMHGINHNDITFRNTVRMDGQFKLIDFDVARMVQGNPDFSLYSEGEQKIL